MLRLAWMPIDPPEASAIQTPVLLIEVDSDARLRHELTLRSAGYLVRVFATCPGAGDLHQAALVLVDVASYEVLRRQQNSPLPPVVVLADDDRSGVSACLRGAAAWAPARGQAAYLVDTIGGVLHASHRAAR